MRDLGLDGDREQRARLAGIVEIIAERVGDRFGHHDRPGEMDNGIDLVAQEHAADEVVVAHVALDELRFRRHRPAEAGRKIVDDEDVLSGVEQLEHHMAADEAGPTRDEHTH
jgi:hypothetical protein